MSAIVPRPKVISINNVNGRYFVDVTAEPIFIKSAIANGSNGWGR